MESLSSSLLMYSATRLLSDEKPILLRKEVFLSAAGQGFEPRYHAPEACVLPLDDPAILIL